MSAQQHLHLFCTPIGDGAANKNDVCLAALARSAIDAGAFLNISAGTDRRPGPGKIGTGAVGIDSAVGLRLRMHAYEWQGAQQC